MIDSPCSLPAGTACFFTASLEDSTRRDLVEHIDLFKHAVAVTRHQRPFVLTASVVLPNHLHMLWELPPGDNDPAGRLGQIRQHFEQSLRDIGAWPPSGAASGVLWAENGWMRTLRDPQDIRACIDYIHWNPVRHGLVGHPGDWPYSTWHDHARRNPREAPAFHRLNRIKLLASAE